MAANGFWKYVALGEKNVEFEPVISCVMHKRKKEEEK